MSTALFPSTVPAASTAITVGPLAPCPAENVTCTTTTQLRIEPAAVRAPGDAPPPALKSEVLRAWPRSAQWATAFLLGLAVALVAVYSVAHLRSGSRPLELEHGAALTYRVNLNHARRAELLQLPGIGPNMVERVEEFREANGGFQSVQELTRIKGYGPALLERLRPWVTVEPANDATVPVSEPKAERNLTKMKAPASKNKKIAGLTTPMDINNASMEELRKLPGIGPKMSQRIVDAREKARFQAVDELRRVPGIGPKTMERLRPYVTVRNQAVRTENAE